MELSRADIRRFQVGVVAICAAFFILIHTGIPISGWLEPKNTVQIVAARTRIANLRDTLRLYIEDNHQPPTTAQGLHALIKRPAFPPMPSKWQGPYLSEVTTIPADPSGNDYLYQSPDPQGEVYVITSLGHDGRPGGNSYDADISSSDLLPKR